MNVPIEIEKELLFLKNNYHDGYPTIPEKYLQYVDEEELCTHCKERFGREETDPKERFRREETDPFDDDFENGYGNRTIFVCGYCYGNIVQSM